MKNAYCVIMAGGIGSRFWPLSKTQKPKQFLDILGTGRTLIQQTFDRFHKLMPSENIYVVSNKIYKDIILEQLPELTEEQVLLEPAMRNTAPCIAYATYKIMSKDPDANFVVAPSDHLILKEEEFIRNISDGLKFTEESGNLLTLGIKPSRPETGYGYIQIKVNEEGSDSIFNEVKTFTEKPDLELAKVFLESGDFYWNSGIFLWKGDAILTAFNKYLTDVAHKFAEGKSLYYTQKEQAFIEEAYPSCKNISIDYGIMEKADNVYVLCADFGWSDLGTWGSLYDQLPKDDDANASNKKVFMYDSKNNLINVPEDKIVVLQGLEDFIVVESDDTLLICKMSEEQRIKHFVNDVKLELGTD
ncbi:mannose-1-phosphate guanylyltransferase [Saccharicrinis sp. FJH62]|uniref:mannose-1-phosphate guanylyltransferase n=1 Tax=Saccharicrinis sp. FJH62 TaxID=3344657 RepID=UPI0035D50D65